MSTRTALAGILVALVPAASAHAANPWAEARIMNMARQGGEYAHPSNTMYAFKQSVAQGADMLTLDVHPTAEGEVVAIHDSRVDRTTNGSGYVSDMALSQVQALDAAYNFIPGRNAVAGQPASSYPFRGVRTGERPPPTGFGREDFRIPTLREVLQAFPHVPINIELKGRSDAELFSYHQTAEALAKVLNSSGRTDIIVVSVQDDATAYFHSLAPQIGTAPGTAGTALFAAGLPLSSGMVALQPRPSQNGISVTTPEYVRRAHAQGYAFHVGVDSSDENEAFYNRLVDMCVDGIMTAYPARLEAALTKRGLRRPGTPGADPCGGGGPPAERRARRCRVEPQGRLVLRGRTASLRLRRSDASTARCSGRASVSAKRQRSKRRRPARASALGSSRFSLAAEARETTVRFRLSRRARRTLRRPRRRAVVSIRVSGTHAVRRHTLRVR